MMKRWEYHTEFNIRHYALQNRLEALGKAGWELVDTNEHNGDYSIVMKREDVAYCKHLCEISKGKSK